MGGSAGQGSSSGKNAVRIYHLNKNLNKARQWAVRVSIGRTLQDRKQQMQRPRGRTCPATSRESDVAGPREQGERSRDKIEKDTRA